jgi:prostaglandin-E synthase
LKLILNWCYLNLFLFFQKSKFSIGQRSVEFSLRKKESGPFWDRLLKEKTKLHWIKTDFNRWKDEDEMEEDEKDEDGSGLEDVIPFKS